MLAFFPKNLNTYKASGGIEIKNSKPHPLSAADKGWGTQNIPGASSVGRPPKYSEGASPARGAHGRKWPDCLSRSHKVYVH